MLLPHDRAKRSAISDLGAAWRPWHGRGLPGARCPSGTPGRSQLSVAELCLHAKGKNRGGHSYRAQGVELQPDLVLSHYFLAASYLAQSERDAASYQPAVEHFLDATLTDPRWGATWLCLGQIALLCGEYDRSEQLLLNCLEVERRGPGFGYFLGSEMLLATVKQRRGDKLGAREMYAASTASLESCDHVYREAFLALTACGLGDVLLREGRTDNALTEFRRASRLVKEYPRMLGPTAPSHSCTRGDGCGPRLAG